MTFKTMKATIKNRFEVGNGQTISQVIEIERHPFGNAYGNRSGHTITLNGRWFQTYDTRYNGEIPTDAEQWQEWALGLVRELWGHNKNQRAEIINFTEELTEID